MKNWVLILIFLCACSTPSANAHKLPTQSPIEFPALKVVAVGDNATVKKLATMSSPAFDKDVVLPLWGDVEEILKDMESSDALILGHSIYHDAFFIEPSRIYIDQSSDTNLGHHECRFYNLKTHSFEDVEFCLSSPAGGNFSIQELGHSLYFVFGYQEGPGSGEIVSWTGMSDQETVLSYISSPTNLEVDGTAFVLESRFHPSTGKVPEITWSEEDCQCEPGSCGYCAGMYGKTFRWRWEPKSAKVQFLGPVIEVPSKEIRGK